MPEEKKRGSAPQRVPGDPGETRETPSQAEGDRGTIERDLEEKGLDKGSREDPGGGGQGDAVNTPSQAEGER